MYSNKILEIFKNPQKAGGLQGSNGIGKYIDKECGNYVKIYLKIDDNQKIIEISDNLGKTNVPLITGVSLNGDLDLGSKPEIKPLKKSSDMLTVLKKLKDDGYLNRISEMNASDDILIRIITKNNLCFKIRTADDFMRHYDYFKLSMEEGQSNIDVDMTTESNVIIKDRNPKDEEDE